jgi:hypothetical protein
MRLALFASFIAIFAPPSLLHAAQAMTSDAIKNLMTNNTMNGKNLEKNHEFTNYFREDGTAAKLSAKGKKWRGKWRVTEDDQHCVDWGRGKGWRCGAIIDLGNNTYHKLDGDKPRIEFTVTLGNAKNL